MRARPPPTFAQRLILYGLSIAVPVLLMCGVLVYQYSVERYRAIETKALAAAHELATDLEREIRSQLILLETLSGILGPEMDLARLHRTATETLEPRGSHAFVYDMGGWQILNSAVPLGQPLPSVCDPEHIRSIIDLNAPYVSNFVDKKIDRQPAWIVSAPIRRQNEVVGLIGIARSPQKLSELLDKRSRPSELRWYISDRKNMLVAARDAAVIGRPAPIQYIEASDGDAGVGWVDNPAGTPMVRAYVRSKASGWLVAVAVPTAVVEAPLREAWMLFGIGSAVLLALALALATAVARRLHDNVDVLVESAEKLGRGDPLPARNFDTQEFQHIHNALACAAAEREGNEQRRHLLLRELQHRTNNLLAVIASITRRTLLDDRTMPEARDALLGRLQALANASDTLAAAHWQGAEIARVVENEMRAFAGRYTADGPEVLLSAQAAQNMSLVIHELATNAMKHGALSQPEGNVTIAWDIDRAESEPRLLFEWIERGGPPAEAPTRQGFGHTLLKTVLSNAEFKPEIRFDPEGLSYRATVPLSAILASGSEAASAPRHVPAG